MTFMFWSKLSNITDDRPKGNSASEFKMLKVEFFNHKNSYMQFCKDVRLYILHRYLLTKRKTNTKFLSLIATRSPILCMCPSSGHDCRNIIIYVVNNLSGEGTRGGARDLVTETFRQFFRDWKSKTEQGKVDLQIQGIRSLKKVNY